MKFISGLISRTLSMKLWLQVIVALILGAAAGIYLGEDAENLKIFGTIFIKLIKMVIVPLIFFALLSGITSMSGEGNFTRIGLKGFGAYIFTAIFAVFLGLGSGLLFEPGTGVDLPAISDSSVSQQEASSDSAHGKDEKAASHSDKSTTIAKKETPSVIEFLLHLIPTNILGSMVGGEYLQIIIFSIFLGVTINLVGEKTDPLKDVIFASSQVFFKMIGMIIKLAPMGVFGYISWIVGTQGLDIIQSLAKLVFVVLFACMFQYVVFGFMIFFVTGMSPLPFYRKILFTQSIAFSTSSSKATLSTAMAQLQDRMGVSKTNSNFLLPLGVCINMDGTAIYLGICALFFSQAYGIPLGLHEYLVLILTCTLGSIGAAGIPSGSIIFMGMVLTSVGLPIEGIGIILGIDRVLDMVRTTINITGDSAITLMVDHTEGGVDEKIYNSKDV